MDYILQDLLKFFYQFKMSDLKLENYYKVQLNAKKLYINIK